METESKLLSWYFMTTELTEEEFKSTFGNKMIDVTDSAEPVLDIWPYVKQLNEQGIVADSVLNDERVEHVYRTDTSIFDHVLLSGSNSNQYAVVVVDLNGCKITGHYLLDLTSEYDL
ncbi:hypothetical protein HQN86_00395 [Pedobacter panaciterrae]|uniref:hypothetical protein n=1 Tax=Pedobacter panaciterrae TaxID=363849 RepID=UPI00155DA72C|nr:hypothetical protein [Pedobacter panaciterrae]NQX52062.1 hypothetical protein [Pedobacter panaciterrae]